MTNEEMLEILRGKVLHESAEETQQRLNEIADAMEQIVRERDAAVESLKSKYECVDCKWWNVKTQDCDDLCHECCNFNELHWEWRGVQDEQTN